MYVSIFFIKEPNHTFTLLHMFALRAQ